MIVDGQVRPDGQIPDREKEVIVESVEYLRRHDGANEVRYLEGIPYNHSDFEQTFGFNQFNLQAVNLEEIEEVELESFEIQMNPAERATFEVSGMDFLIPLSVSQEEISSLYVNDGVVDNLSFEYDYTPYFLEWVETEENIWLILVGEDQELVEMNLNELRELSEPNEEVENWEREDLTFVEEGEGIRLSLLILELAVEEDSPIDAEMVLLIDFNE